MKKLILAFAIMVSLLSFGQDKEVKSKFKSEQDVESRLKDMTKDLNLSDKQQSEIKILLTEQFSKRQKMREEMKKEKENGAQISDEKRAEMKKHMIDDQLEMKTKMKSILSEEQMKKLGEIRKEKGNEMREERKRTEKPVEKEVKK